MKLSVFMSTCFRAQAGPWLKWDHDTLRGKVKFLVVFEDLCTGFEAHEDEEHEHVLNELFWLHTKLKAASAVAKALTS